ncbi:MAG: hypothetical protein N2490_01770 [Ignavibacteria bacterium]|nr:hypothetical protein [Ignavibacteria bacterium]
MKKTLMFLLLIVLIPFITANSQFDNWSFQLGLGISEPMNELKGESPFIYVPKWTGYWLNYNTTPPSLDSTILYNIILTDSTNFMKQNYGVGTGFSINGAAKVNIDKYNTFRGIITFGFSSFNSFRADKSGQSPFPTNQGFQTVSVTYSNSFTAFGLGLGLEVAPTSFTKVFTPYFGATFNFNFFSANLTRSYGRDSLKADFGPEFRLGAAFHGGLELKVSKGIDIVAGARYDLGNLLLKNTRSGQQDAINYGKTNLSLNDEEGQYYSNLHDPNGVNKTFYAKKKSINWLTFFIGLNFYPSELTPKERK